MPAANAKVMAQGRVIFPAQDGSIIGALESRAAGPEISIMPKGKNNPCQGVLKWDRFITNGQTLKRVAATSASNKYTFSTCKVSNNNVNT